MSSAYRGLGVRYESCVETNHPVICAPRYGFAGTSHRSSPLHVVARNGLIIRSPRRNREPRRNDPSPFLLTPTGVARHHGHVADPIRDRREP
jgi:hypothetical protein